ncbi:MAG: response regulator transcription factor [Lachnospiraceae bacterium]|nr:response regulator transcription factor [Lachnospiraceae bacterium]
MRIAICDDQEYISAQLHRLLAKYQRERDVQIETSYFSLPSLLHSDMQEKPFDLIFMDLEFENNEEDGILWSKKIHQDFPKALILILTGYPHRYKEGYIVRAFRFMTKPIIEDELFEYLDDCLNELQIATQISFFRSGISHKIFLKDILYFQAQSGGSELFTYDNNYYCDESLLQWENTLPPHLFFRCHKKYLVNLGQISSFKNHTVVLKNGVKLSVSRRKWTSLLSAYMKFDIHTKQAF